MVVDNILNNKVVPTTERWSAAGWDLPVTTKQTVSFALKCTRAKRPVQPLAQVIEALVDIGEKRDWITEDHYHQIIDRTGTTLKFLRASLGRINEWMANMRAYVATLGTPTAAGLAYRDGVMTRGIRTALIMAGDASSVAPMALIPAVLAGARTVAKASSADPMPPFLFLQALLKRGIDVPQLLYLNSASEHDRELIRMMIKECEQSVVYGEDRTVEGIYAPIGLSRAHKAIGFWSGRSGIIVRPDADLELAARCILEGTDERGNRCVCTKKAFVPRSLQRELESELLRQVRALHRGDPHHPDTDVGVLDPGIRSDALAAVAGDELLFDQDVILARVRRDSPLMRDELPYPIVGLYYHGDDEDPIELANSAVASTPTGWTLALAIVTRSQDEFERIAAGVHACKVLHNRPSNFMDHATPHQGIHLCWELMRPKAYIR